MKRIIISFVLFLLIWINYSFWANSISATKTEIDVISCDLNFTWKMRKGFSYNFSDTFTNPSNKDIKVEEVKVHIYEESDFNNSSNLPSFSFTDWANSKNNILNPWDNWVLIESDNSYQVLSNPNSKNWENFKITYTAKYFYKTNSWDFSDWPHYHTECKDYSVSWCWDWIVDWEETCDINDSSKKNWGTNGCNNLCEPDNRICLKSEVTKTNIFEWESSVVSCEWNDVKIFKIDCWDWNEYVHHWDWIWNEKFSHFCSYSKKWNYTATCQVDDIEINNDCKNNIEVKNKVVSENNEIIEKKSELISLYVQKDEWLWSLETKATCVWENIKSYKLDCGNWKIFSELINKDWEIEILKTCNYSKPWKYIISCSALWIYNPIKDILKKEVLVKDKIVKYKIVEEEIVEKKSELIWLYIQKDEWISSLETKIACTWENIKSYKLDCGNWQIFYEDINKDWKSKILKTCNYSKYWKYIVSCSALGIYNPIKNILKKEVIVKEKILTELENKLSENKIRENYLYYKNIKEELDIIKYDENKIGAWIIKMPKILPKTGWNITDRVKKIKNSKLEIDTDNNRFRLAWSKNTDINFWKQVLDKEEQNRDKYIVTPSNWLVLAINDVPNNIVDYKELLSWREINVNKYLKTGSMEYPWTSINWYGEVGNKVIFAHSSYWKNDDGRYKADFQKIIELDIWEEIWIYEKIDWIYKRFKYKTIESYNTKANDVSVLESWIWKNITLFTCTPIGWIEWRWIVKAKYIDDNKIKLEEKINFNSVDRKIKIKISNFVNNLAKLEQDIKKEKILKIFNLIVSKEGSIKNKKIIDVLDYLKYKLSLEYYK